MVQYCCDERHLVVKVLKCTAKILDSLPPLMLLLICLLLGIFRSDIEAVLIVMLDDILCSEPESNPHQDIVSIFLNTANFSESHEGCAESSMSFEDFRQWCALLPSVRKYLGSLLSPSDPGFCFYC